MFVQIVKFESRLTKEEMLAVADSRLEAYRATPGLIEKFYCEYFEPNHYGGVLIWDSLESLHAFSQTELARTIAEVYQVVGKPKIEVANSMYELREVMTNAT